MSTTPVSLRELGSLWMAKGGVILGVVGNQKHCAGYHLGRDRIYSACACKPDGTCHPGGYAKDYSVQHARDRTGLTNAASALDLGKLNGSFEQLQAFSRWLVGRCQQGAPGTEDIREVIYSPDGTAVRRWDAVSQKLYVGGTGTGHGDNGHRTHTHISFFRDSETRDKRPAFAPYFQPSPPPAPDPEAAVIRANFSTSAGKATAVRPGSRFDLETRQPTPFATGFVRNVVTTATLAEQLSPSLPVGELMLVTTWGDPDRLELIRAADTDWPKGMATVPEADCAEEIKSATDPLRQQIGTRDARIRTAVTALGGTMP